jgi:hypothetical protein
MTYRFFFPLAAASLIASAATPAGAEVVLPSRSPSASVSQEVGLTKITVDYSSPAVGGRRIWGQVVTPGVLWRTGERTVPKVTFSRDVVFGNAPVAAGSYALLTIPSDGDWTVILNRDAKLGGVADYKPELDIARVKARASAVPHRERLTFLFSDFTDEQVSLDLEWETRRVAIPIHVRTAEQMMAAIKGLDDIGRRYADTAAYMMQTKKDYEAGLAYVNRSIVLGETWYNRWIKASLLAAQGDYSDARAEADRAYELGRKAGDTFTLEPAVRQAIADWNRAPDRRRPPTLEKQSAWADRPPGAPPASSSPVPLPPLPVRPSADSRPTETGPDLTSLHTEIQPARSTVVVPRERGIRVRDTGAAAGPSKPPGAAEIGPLIKKGKTEIQACYQKALRQDPTLTRARISVSISVGISGLVKNVTLDPPHPSGVLEACIKEAISRWVFPLSPVEYGTEFPLVLRGKE